MTKAVASLVFLSVFYMNANADPVQECMVKAKIFQNPSALAGAAEICMQGYFDSLKAEADACRADAATKTFVDASYAACQGSLILGLREQVGICKDEAKGLLKEKDDLTARVSEGAGAGCEGLVEQAVEICRDNANKFTGLAQSAATTACETAGLFLLVPAQVYVGNFLESFKEYPPRMKAASFSIDQVMEKMKTSGQSH